MQPSANPYFIFHFQNFATNCFAIGVTSGPGIIQFKRKKEKGEIYLYFLVGTCWLLKGLEALGWVDVLQISRFPRILKAPDFSRFF